MRSLSTQHTVFKQTALLLVHTGLVVVHLLALGLNDLIVYHNTFLKLSILHLLQNSTWTFNIKLSLQVKPLLGVFIWLIHFSCFVYWSLLFRFVYKLRDKAKTYLSLIFILQLWYLLLRNYLEVHLLLVTYLQHFFLFYYLL